MVPGVLVVAATNQNDERASFSNYGSCIDVSAPGVNILSTCIGSPGYCYMNGTSMAAPMVVGLAGLLKSERPDWDRVKIRDAIVLTADPIDVEEEMGSGRINAQSAVKQTFPPTAPSNLNAEPTAWTQIDLNWQDNSDSELGFEIERTTTPPNFSKIGEVGKDVTSYQDTTASAGITYYYRVRAYNLGGNSSFSNTASTAIPTGPPAAPNFLDGWFSFATHCVELTWHDNANNEQGFAIERKSEYLPWWQEIARVGHNNFYDDCSVDPDTYYQYRVRAYNPSGYSSYSNIAHVYVRWY